MLNLNPICINENDTSFWEQLIDDEGSSDTKIVIKDKLGQIIWEFEVHSIVLRRRSEVFKRLITQINEVITLENIDIFVVKKFLKYLYVDDIYVETWQEIVQLLDLSKKFEMVTLTSELEKSLMQFISLINVCQFLEISQRLHLKDAEKLCLDMIVRGAVIVLGTSGYQKLSEKNFALILSDQRLNVSSEFEVVKALICWAKTNALIEGAKIDHKGIYLKIKSLLKHVRLSQITAEQSLLLPKEIGDLIFSDLDGDAESVETRIPSKEECILSNFADLLLKIPSSTTANTNIGSGRSLVLRFSVTMPIFLGGLMLNYESDVDAVVKIVVRPLLEDKAADESVEGVSYTLNVKKTCQHVLTNEPRANTNHKGHCYEPDHPILITSKDDCNVYVELPDSKVSFAPRINFPFSWFKTEEGPIFKVPLGHVLAVRKIHFLSACGRCLA